MTVVILLAISVARRVQRNTASRPRLTLLARPPRDLDPSDEEVDRYAGQLARTRRLTGRRSSAAIRLRLDAEPQGRVAYRIQGPRTVASILTVPGYSGLQLLTEHPPEDTGDTP